MSRKDSFQLFFSKTNDFLNIFLLRQAHRSEETVKAYRISLSEFYTYVTVVRRLNVMKFLFSDCTYDFVLSYSQYMQENLKLANSTVNQRLAALKSYLKYVADGDIAVMQIYISVQKVPLLRISKLQRPIIEKDAMTDILNIPPNTNIGNRDRLILILLFDSAVRVSELASIEMKDLTLNVAHTSILIHGKGRKMRSVFLNDKCAAHLKEYISHFHSPDEPEDTPLFYTKIHGKLNHMSVRNIERIVKKYSDMAREEHPEMPDSVYPHMLRRTRATELYRDGVPLEMISLMLGHANTETTKIYASPSVEQLREELTKGSYEHDEEERLWDGREEEIKKMFGLT